MSFRDITIITGGQTGVDRAAMDFALACNIACSGYCPKGRIAEDGFIPDVYPLKETITSDYSERTRKNIEQSDGVVIFYDQLLDKGTKLTIELCKVLNCPFLIIKILIMRYHTSLKNDFLYCPDPKGSRENQLLPLGLGVNN